MTTIEIENLLKVRESEEQKNPDLYKSRFELFYEGFKNGEISYEEFEPEIERYGEHCTSLGNELSRILHYRLKDGINKFISKNH